LKFTPSGETAEKQRRNTMSDIKDIMGLPKGGVEGMKAQKAKKAKLQKPKGMSREAYALMTETHPYVMV